MMQLWRELSQENLHEKEKQKEIMEGIDPLALIDRANIYIHTYLLKCL